MSLRPFLGTFLGCGIAATLLGCGKMETGPPAASRTVSVGGSTVHYLEMGPATGAAVIFLHGARYDSADWKSSGILWGVAQDGYHALAVDLPGSGASQPRVWEDGDFLPALLDALELRDSVVVAPSASGRVALPAIARHPERFRAFVGIAPVGIPEWVDELRDSPVPIYLIWSRKDPVVPYENGNELALVVRKASQLTLPGTAHAVYLQRPASFTKGLLEFLHRLPG